MIAIQPAGDFCDVAVFFSLDAILSYLFVELVEMQKT
jgi:hypothetical protein